MKLACIIPARGGSKGIPSKNIIPLAGKPLVAWSIEHGLSSKKLEGEVYVSSDSDEILSVSKQFGSKTIKRPASLASDTASSESALIQALDEIESIRGKLDYVVFLQPTSPIRMSDDIDNALEKIVSENADSLFSSRQLKDFCLWDKDDEGRFFSSNFDYKNRKRRQEWPDTYLENGSLYIFRPHLLRETNNRLGKKITTYEMDYPRSLQIDNHEDIDVCEYYLMKRKK